MQLTNCSQLLWAHLNKLALGKLNIIRSKLTGEYPNWGLNVCVILRASTPWKVPPFLLQISCNELYNLLLFPSSKNCRNIVSSAIHNIRWLRSIHRFSWSTSAQVWCPNYYSFPVLITIITIIIALYIMSIDNTCGYSAGIMSNCPWLLYIPMNTFFEELQYDHLYATIYHFLLFNNNTVIKLKFQSLLAGQSK